MPMNSTYRSRKALRILLAEDNRSDANYLSKIIRDMGYEVIVAENGLSALECYFSENVDIAILDIDLPEMSGTEVAENIQSDVRSIPIIFTTATVDKRLFAECFRLGADDFILKPYDVDLVKIKLRSYHNIIRMRSMLETQRDLIAKSNRTLITEQKSARRIFDKLSYSSGENNPNVRYNSSALSVFNGDLVLSAQGPGGELFVFLGDFTGHGLVASLSSMPLIQTFYRMVEKGFSMAMILQEINSRLHKTLPREIFCCGVMAMLDPRAEELHLWNGGLPDCYVFSNQNSSYETIASKHLPLGVLNSDRFRLKIDVLQMKIDDRLLMCSDGILEARNPNKAMFGSERMIEVLDSIESGDDLFAKIEHAVGEFTDGGIRDDDVSLVELTMPAPAEIVSKAKVEGTRDKSEKSKLSGSLNYLIEPEMMRGGNPIVMLMQMLLEIPGLKTIRSELFTAMTELYANALDHGLLELDSSLKGSAEGFDQFYRMRKEKLDNLKDGSIRFVFTYESSESTGNLHIRAEDTGKGFDVAGWNKQQQSKNNFSGRGLSLIAQLSSSMDIIEPGNVVEIAMCW